MLYNMHSNGFAGSIGHIVAHAVITLLAVGIAFSLPVAAQYILYSWWPKVADDSQLLLFSEISFAAMLVLLFNMTKITWDNRRIRRMSKIA